jgi:hypothetical protein
VAGIFGQFGTLDLQTRVYSQITASTGLDLTALAENNGQLYVTDDGSNLYSISNTGTMTSIGSAGTTISGLAFNAGGTLYADNLDAQHLGTLSTGTGGYTDKGPFGMSNFNSKGVLAFSNGVLYDAINTGANGLLASLNLTSGAATQIGSSNSLYNFMILFDAQNVLYGISSDNDLYSINTSTAALNLVGAITGSNLPVRFGSAVAGPTSDVPEPSSLGLFAIGALALRWRRKRSR